MRISDWSSDVCSSDLEQQHEEGEMGHGGRLAGDEVQAGLGQRLGAGFGDKAGAAEGHRGAGPGMEQNHEVGRASVEGKAVLRRVEIGGRGILVKKKK